MCIAKVKKDGFVLFEVLALLNIIIFLIIFYSKSTIGNVQKEIYYFSKDDVRTLAEEEEALIKYAERKVNEDNDLKSKILSPNDINNVSVIYKVKAGDSMWIDINLGKIFLVKEVYKMKKYRQLKVISYAEGNQINAMFIPTLYKSDFIK